MLLRDHRSWHRFTYGLLYPAVLGSMLYDILHMPPTPRPLRLIALSITLLYCLDSLYLASDLGTDQFPKGCWRDTVFDAGIAVAFGFAYWRASDQQLVAAYGCLVAISLAILAYNCFPSRRTRLRVGWLVVLCLLYAGLLLLAWRVLELGWTLAVASWLPVVWYTLYVFRIVNISVPPAGPGADAPVAPALQPAGPAGSFVEGSSSSSAATTRG